MDIAPLVDFLFRFAWNFLVTWWWLLLPLFLWDYFKMHWLWWRNEVFDSTYRKIVLEIKMPPDVVKPIKAMENVFSVLWQVYDPPNERETWIDGKYQLSFQLEIASTEGEVHFYIRIPEGFRKLVETAFHGQYPGTELALVDDYTKLLPRNIPNKDWELWGTDYKMEKPWPYPIRTYASFFEEKTGEKEEQKVDPMALLFEGLSKIGKGEHIWIQFQLKPIAPHEMNYAKMAQKIVYEIVKRVVPKESGGLTSDIQGVMGSLAGGTVQDIVKVGGMLATGKEIAVGGAAAQAEEKELFPYEMRLTPGEREIVSAIEAKIGKQSFRVIARFIYIARRENYFSPTKAIPMSFFTQFGTANLNTLRPLPETITKSHTFLRWFLDKRLAFLKKRKLFRAYIYRTPMFFPHHKMEKDFMVLNTEELATLYHFSGKVPAPSIAAPRVGAQKGEAPPNLPTE